MGLICTFQLSLHCTPASENLPRRLVSRLCLEATVAEGIIDRMPARKREKTSVQETDGLTSSHRVYIILRGDDCGSVPCSSVGTGGGPVTRREPGSVPGRVTHRHTDLSEGRRILLLFVDPEATARGRDRSSVSPAVPSALSLRADRRMCLVGQGLLPSAWWRCQVDSSGFFSSLHGMNSALIFF